MANPIGKMKTIIEMVTDVLHNYPKSRDNDNYLSCVVWHKQVRAKHEGDVTFDNFLTMYSNNMLSSSDSITRCARKIKETNPHLRGTNHKLRKDLEQQTRMNIRNL